MDILDQIAGNTPEPVALETANTVPAVSPAPLSALRNRAAVSAVLSDNPAGLVQNYQTLLAQSEQGDVTAAKNASAAFFKEDKTRDTKAVMSVLGDPSLSVEQKRGAIDAMKNSPVLKDSGTAIVTKGLEAASDGETYEAEDARISTAEALSEMYAARDKTQALVNAHGAYLPDLNAAVTVDALEVIMLPFATNASAYRIAKAMAAAKGEKLSTWQTIKALTFGSGTVIADIRKQLEVIPPEGRVEYTNKILDVIKNSGSAIFPTDNAYNQFTKAQAIFGEGGYSGFDEFVDNAVFLLDIIGVGQVLRAERSVKALKAPVATPVSPASLPLVAGPSGTPQGRLPSVSGWAAKPEPVPMVGKNEAKIAKLQDEVASLLGESGNQLGKGEVAELRRQIASIPKPNDSALKEMTKQLQASEKLSYKDATSKATKLFNDQVAEYEAKVGRLNEMLNSNSRASTVTQKISDLEKQITSLSKSNTLEPAKLNPIVDAIRRIEVNSVVRIENPSSISSMLHQSNPTQARAVFQSVFKSESDAVAEGLYGTGKAQAIINDVYPQALTEGRSVLAKAPDVQRNLRLDPELDTNLRALIRSSDVGIHYSKEELAAARANIVNDFSHATDLVPNDALGGFSSGFKLDGTGIEISAVYGTKEGAFLRAEDAISQAEYALRNQGVGRENVEILHKEGLDYVPVNLEDVRGRDGSYLLRVNVRREVDPTDITKFDTPDSTRLNFFDRNALAVWERSGSVSRWMFDAASMLPKRLTGAAVVATDMSARFEKQMLDLATNFSKDYNALDKARRAKVDEYIKEANFKGIPFDQTDLIARGFIPNEIETLRSWKEFWDAHYVLENHDILRTLNSQGFQMFKNAQTELYARPIAKNTQLGKIYDPASGMVVHISSDVIDDLYTKGGTIARLRRPTEFSFGMPNGTSVKSVTDSTEYMIVRNTPTEYLRKFRDTDEVLNYRDGYYQIQYNAPRFVDEITLDKSGRETARRAVAVAGDTKEAEHFANRQRSLNPDKQYKVRADDRAAAKGSDDWFDLNSVSGRIAQRHRGKLLEDATGINHLGDGTYIVNPVESAIRASKSIAGRTVSRPMLESAKARYIQQFSDVLPSDGRGGKAFPSTLGEIGAKGEYATSHVADARTAWEYIHYLENGYINGIDEFVKAKMNSIATALGEAGWTKAERLALRTSELQHGPTGFAKNFVFHAYIGTNILRNWVVQTNQVLRTFAYNPQGWLTGSMSKLLGEYSGIKMGALKNPSAEGAAFTRFMDESGLLDSVDKQNLVRGSLLDAAGSSHKAARILGKAIELPRKVGFDAGESMNLLGHGAAVFDRYRRAGKDMTDLATLREAHSEVRAISYDMNFAGDMVYNQTSAAALLQFMQVPHKAFLQATNRRIPIDLRARMLAADMVLWGPPVALISAVMGGDIMPEDEKTHELFLHGLQGVSLNNMFSHLLGEKVDVDFSSLAPYDMEGWGKMFHAMYSGGLEQLINNSPAGQMFLADGGRIQSAIAAMSRFFSPWTPGERTPEEAAAVANEVAKIASGWNNAMKARQMFALGKSFDKYGNVIDPNVNSIEAAMQLFGFGTGSTKALYETQRLAAEGTKAYEEEVLQVYKEIKQYYQSAFNAGITDMKQHQAVSGQLLEAYKDSPVAMDIIQKQLQKDLAGKDIQLMYMMMKAVDIPNHALTVDQIRKAPISDEQKELYIERLTHMRNARSEINKDK